MTRVISRLIEVILITCSCLFKQLVSEIFILVLSGLLYLYHLSVIFAIKLEAQSMCV